MLFVSVLSVTFTLNAQENSVGAVLGTGGYGFRYFNKFNDHLALTAGYSAATLGTRFSMSINNQDSYINIDLKSNTAFLRIHYSPSENSNMSFVGGLNYFFSTRANFQIDLKNKIPYGDLMLDPRVIGNVKSAVLWDGVSPYLGVEWRTYMGENWAISFDAGINYMPKPKVEYFEGSDLLKKSFLNLDQFQSNINNYRWLPILEIGIHYKISN